MNIKQKLQRQDFAIKFCQIYSSNFQSKHLKDFVFDSRNYSGKPIEVKLVQFELDWNKNKMLYK